MGNNVKCNRNKIGQWEKMKIVRAGGGKFAIRGGKGNKLCADEYNRIICNQGRIGQWEKFKAQDAGFGNIALRGGKRNKLCADEANRISCNRNNIGQWEKFKVQIVKKSAALKLLRHGNVVAFKGGKGRKYCADEGNNVKCNRNKIGQSEEMKIVNAGPHGGKVAIRGGKGNKLCADETNRIICNRNRIGQWEKFEVQNVKKSAALKLLRGGNVVAFKGGKGRKYCADEGNNVKC